MAASWLLSPITLAILLISLTPSSCSPLSPPPSNTISITSSSSSSTTNNVSFAVRLIHITSPESPFYDPNVTREELIIEGVRTSLDRHRYFSQRYLNKAEQIYTKAPLNSHFFMKYSIGTPPVQTFGLLDTGSSAIWLQCSPCVRCYPQSIPIFFPSKSSTYKDVVCGSVECSVFGDGAGDIGCNGGRCTYYVSYADGAYSEGGVFSDTLTLQGDVTGETIATGVLFGCGYNSTTTGKFYIPGVIGMGNDSSSLLGQLLATQFSYLLSTNREDNSMKGWVYFGQLAYLKGFSTPLVPNDMGYYHLFLEGIYVNGERLDISDKFLQMDSYQDGGIIIDTGTAYTMLNDVAFGKIRSEFEAFYQNEEPRFYRGFELCYNDIGDQPPELMFSFRDFNFSISQRNTWVQLGELWCLAMLRVGDSNESILGEYQQRDINIGYDLAHYRLFMTPLSF